MDHFWLRGPYDYVVGQLRSAILYFLHRFRVIRDTFGEFFVKFLDTFKGFEKTLGKTF